MHMIRCLSLLEKAVLYFHNLQKFYVKKQASILGMKKRAFIASLKMKMRRKEFFILWIGNRKQVKIPDF